MSLDWYRVAPLLFHALNLLFYVNKVYLNLLDPSINKLFKRFLVLICSWNFYFELLGDEVFEFLHWYLSLFIFSQVWEAEVPDLVDNLVQEINFYHRIIRTFQHIDMIDLTFKVFRVLWNSFNYLNILDEALVCECNDLRENEVEQNLVALQELAHALGEWLYDQVYIKH